MAEKKYLDKLGLTYLVNKIKALIPTKTSDLTNDSDYTTNDLIIVGNEEDVTENTKLLIEDDEPDIVSEVVNSLEGNEIAKAPSVRTVNEALNGTEWYTLTEGCKYRKIGNIVNIRGWIPIDPTENWGNNNWRGIGTLPTGYRPSENIATNIYIYTGTTNVYCFDIILQILADGNVRCSNRSGATLSVQSIHFNETYFVD